MAVFETEVISALQYKRLRRDVGASVSVIDDILAEEYFLEAQERFPNDTAKMIAEARVIALRGIRADSAMLGKYAQNQSEEDLTKVFDNLTIMLKDAIGNVAVSADVITDSTSFSPYFITAARGRRGQ